jgi:hypothetical protein
MTMIRIARVAALTFAVAAMTAPTFSYAAGPTHGTRIKSNATLNPGWYCIIREKMSDGSWVCRLQEKRN